MSQPKTSQRRTRQREAIRRALDETGRPMSPTELLEAARAEVPGMGIATVYRNLKAMAEANSVQTVDLPGEPPRYEIARKGHHHHFHCRRCDRVFEVDNCPGNMKKLAPRGFRVDDHDITLYGLCASCRKGA
ncbi:MAG: transcriptional repressor [Planctomycetota bacterium]